MGSGTSFEGRYTAAGQNRGFDNRGVADPVWPQMLLQVQEISRHGLESKDPSGWADYY